MSRHLRFQVAISLGLIVAASLASLVPDAGHASTFIALSTNIVWLWEPGR